MSETVKKVVTPNDKTIRTVFGQTKAFFIDIYQREYRWSDAEVNMLLNDIEMRFELYPRKQTSPSEIQKDVNSNFDPYYMNTFLTHASVNSPNLSIIDGQQRLTTFLLILIKLHNIVRAYEKAGGQSSTFSVNALSKNIYEESDFGDPAKFKIYNADREKILRELIKETPDEAIVPEGETQCRLWENYKIISQYFDRYFNVSEKPVSEWDVSKITYYITYLLDKIVMVEIRIEQQRDVAMIFEVVNDRGLPLEPYEILKGKLIGNLPDEQKEEANTIWCHLQDEYFKAKIANSSEGGKISLDDFFRTYLRSKFANTENEYERFEGDYHYEIIYKNPCLREFFGHFQDNEKLFSLIKNEIQYFAELYYRLRTTYDYEHVIYNKLLSQNQQTFLIMSAINLNDPQCDEKIKCVARKFDQLHVILRLLDAYSSSTFQRIIYPLAAKIRGKGIAEINEAFDAAILDGLRGEGKINDSDTKLADIFRYELFSNIRNADTNFSKYILMRIDRYLAQLLDKPSYAAGDLQTLEEHFNRSTRRIYGMHLEHIIAFNDANKKHFTDDRSVFNDAKFNETRNRLGAVLLLKDKQNESSNNALYSQKFIEYRQSNFIWNEWLVGELHNVDSKNLPAWGVDIIRPAEDGTFPLDQIESRQKAIYNAINAIWNF